MSDGQSPTPPVPPPPPASPPPASPPPPAAPPQYSAPPPAAAAKQGLPTWAKVAIGCGCLIILAGVVLLFGTGWAIKKGAEEVQQKVEELEQGGSITIPTGEGGVTIGGNEDGEGFSIKTAEGEMTIGGAANLDNLPSWVILYPEASAEGGGLSTTQGNKASGGFTATTADDSETVAAWYEDKMKDEGFTVEKSTISFGSMNQIILAGKQDGRTMNVAISTDDQATGTTMVISYDGTI